MEPEPQSPPVKGVGRLEYLGAHPRQWVAEGCPWHLWLLLRQDTQVQGR